MSQKVSAAAMVVINRPALIENELDHRVLDAPLSTAKVGVVGQGYVRHQAGRLVCAAELPMPSVNARPGFRLVFISGVPVNHPFAFRVVAGPAVECRSRKDSGFFR